MRTPWYQFRPEDLRDLEAAAARLLDAARNEGLVLTPKLSVRVLDLLVTGDIDHGTRTVLLDYLGGVSRPAGPRMDDGPIVAKVRSATTA